MATKTKSKASESLFGDEDLFDSLFKDIKQPIRTRGGLSEPANKSPSTKDGLDFEDSDVSAADPNDILKNMEEKPSAVKTKQAENESLKKASAVLDGDGNHGTDKSPGGVKKPTPSSPPVLKKTTFSDLDDSLSDPLDNLLPDETKPKAKPRQAKPDKSSPSASPKMEVQTTRTSKKDLFLFENDDLTDLLGLDNEKKNPPKKESPLWSAKERWNSPQRPHTKIDDILEGVTSQRLPERPPTGEKKEQLPSYEKPKTSIVREEDLTFGSYQPTLGSTPEGRQSRRQSVRFSTEDVSASTPERRPKPSSSRHRNSLDWLGFAANEEQNNLEDDSKETRVSAESQKASSLPFLERKSPSTGIQNTSVTKRTDTQSDAKPEVSRDQKKKEEEEEDWLTQRKKTTPSASNEAAKPSKQEDLSGFQERVDLDWDFSLETLKTPRGIKDTIPSVRETSPAAHSTRLEEERPKQVFPQSQMQSTPVSVQQQVFSSAGTPQQQQTRLRSLGVVDGEAPQTLKDKQAGDYQSLKARITELEGQLKILQLERGQTQMMLESIQLRHAQDVEFMENAHRARVKLLEEAAAQRETRSRLECEDLIERMAALTRAVEQERSELQAQYHRKVAQVQQDRDREVERLRDLQRQSILEMKKDHEDQIQRLKRLKEEEIDAVTSATSQTRSLTGVIEQMEQFSSRLEELSSRVESAHEQSAHGLERGARHREEQLRVLEDRLSQQQKATAEERSYLKEIISRMDAQINEQQRQLEKERWKVASEQAKVESLQRSLEEERRVLNMQTSMEREELERAKSVLLEEQKSVMQHCAEERRKLAAEWAHFHDQDKRRHERAEREVSSLLDKREGSIITLAQEQADLKLRTAELKQKEMAAAQERETLERLREELEREKEKISSAALRLETRALEVESFSKLAANKYEEGEEALREAKRVEAEHEARLKSIHSQMESLRMQENRILKERTKLNYLQDKAQQTQTSSFKAPPVLPVSVLPTPELTADFIPNLSANHQSIAREACLALWKYTAEKETEFLQEEQIYLDNLRKKSYRLNTT
ncbi:fas-binding factor 1 isoform X2 [Oryzias latipes]|uniref:fas-binding factor 1 isoform X2 n=1 Tax=Oryzias latipes TaxID=8090 RepID=UPI0009D9F28C|nr:fas-binding factor 1 isoform X2 [Oryzias latipes]